MESSFHLMETLVGTFRSFLPARYWQDLRHGAIISIFLTLASGAYIGLKGLVAYATNPFNPMYAPEARVRKIEMIAPWRRSCQYRAGKKERNVPTSVSMR